MRIIVAGLLAILSLADPALAADAAAPGDAAARQQDQLEQLQSDLKRERNERAAERIAGRIRALWSRSGSASIDLLVQWSDEAVENRKYDAALDFLDQVTTLQPGFAEGWNRRATVHFLMRQFGKAMSDIEHTLALEPRHFGALAGMAQIMKETGRKELALEAWARVLSVYPMMRSAQDEYVTLSDELAGEGI